MSSFPASPHSKKATECLEEAIKLVSAAVGDAGRPLLGLILTGSAARGEMTIVERDDRMVWLSDLEFLVPIDSPAELPRAREELKGVRERLELQLKQGGQEIEIELTPAPREYFATLKPRIFSVELKAHGRTIFGEQMLDLVADTPSDVITLEEAWRLTSNRLVERLSADLEWDRLPSIKAAYGLSKLALDLLTSTSIFSKSYESSYRQRYRRRADVLAWVRREGMEQELAERYVDILDWAMQLKTQEGSAAGLVSWRPICQAGEERQELETQRRDLTRIALTIWAMQLSHFTGATRPENSLVPSPDALRRADSLYTKIRGWAAAAVKTGLSQRRHVLTRGARFAFAASPRSLLYGCVWTLLEYRGSSKAELLDWAEEHLPAGLRRDPDADRWRRLSRDSVEFWRTVLRMSAT